MTQYLSFHPVKKVSSLIGFVSFKWSDEFQFTEIPVHKLLKPKDGLWIRLLYPENARPKGNIYKEILKDINAYILANYIEYLK